MPRAPRLHADDGIVHVWARGNDQQAIFLDDEDRRRYLTILGQAVLDSGWRCLAYCLMTNHVHLLLETERAELGRGMCWAHGSYARAFNRRHGRRNHLFGDRFGSKAIFEPEHLRYAAAYLALNPVRAGMCAEPEQWPWSSYGAMLGVADPPAWLSSERMLAVFRGLAGPRVTAAAEFVAAVRRQGA